MLLDIFSDYIAFKIYRIAGSTFAQIGVRVGIGDDGDLRDAIFPARDGEADAVDGDRAFADDIAGEIFRDFDGQPPAVAFALQFGDPADRVNVAENEVTAEFFSGGERLLEVDERAGFQGVRCCAEGSLSDRFSGEIGGKTFCGEGNHGEAAAVYRDAL